MSARERSGGGDCLMLTTYFGERDRTPNGLLADELAEIYGAHELRASVLLRGAEGFGRKQHARTDRLLTLSEDLPVVSVAVDSRERIESVMESVRRVERNGLITRAHARMLAGDPGPLALPLEGSQTTKMTVFVGRGSRTQGLPPFVGVCELLHRRGLAGATALLGVDGTLRGRRLRARFFASNAEVPTMVVAVGSGELIAQVLPELVEVLSEPLLTFAPVQLCKRDGELLARPHELAGKDQDGVQVCQKLTVYTSHAATHDGRPLHMEIVRRLRAAGAAGATAVRGVWGFHGEHAPHGDRLFQIRRHVPVMTTAIDTPERTVGSFAIIDELTREHGLVTSEPVRMIAVG